MSEIISIYFNLSQNRVNLIVLVIGFIIVIMLNLYYLFSTYTVAKYFGLFIFLILSLNSYKKLIFSKVNTQ